MMDASATCRCSNSAGGERRRAPGPACHAIRRRSRRQPPAGGRTAALRRSSSPGCPSLPSRHSQSVPPQGEAPAGRRASADELDAGQRDTPPQPVRLRDIAPVVRQRRPGGVHHVGRQVRHVGRQVRHVGQVWPASSRVTSQAGSSLSRAASTHPAEPPPTTSTSSTLAPLIRSHCAPLRRSPASPVPKKKQSRARTGNDKSARRRLSVPEVNLPPITVGMGRLFAPQPVMISARLVFCPGPSAVMGTPCSRSGGPAGRFCP